jgi:hypothetical protein
VAYAVVRDVASSWENYHDVTAPALTPWPTGLLFHAAGPTDEGYRVIDIWTSEIACGAFEARFDPGGDAPRTPHHPTPTLRTLRAEVLLASWRELARRFAPASSHDQIRGLPLIKKGLQAVDSSSGGNP